MSLFFVFSDHKLLLFFALQYFSFVPLCECHSCCVRIAEFLFNNYPPNQDRTKIALRPLAPCPKTGYQIALS